VRLVSKAFYKLRLLAQAQSLILLLPLLRLGWRLGNSRAIYGSVQPRKARTRSDKDAQDACAAWQ
jgi:hypothetical protein